jgi:Ca2+-binding EF-hand superfamily protein
MTSKGIVLIATSFVVGTISTSAFAANKQTNAAANRDVRELVRMMDKDMNGTVSKDEFMAFMAETFDRLDVKKSGTLGHGELRPLTTTRNWIWPDCRRAFPSCRGGGQ